jgi:phospholipid/cholesterol/gamma-HCH transport system substrate-binding protein
MCTGLLVGTIANWVGGDTTAYAAKFTDVTGLNVGDEVRVAGVRIGQVDDIGLVDRKVALVKFSVQRSLELPTSTVATIKYRNLIGQRYVALDQGPGTPGSMLAPGATLPLTQTHSAVNLTQLFNGFKPLFAALSPGDVNKLSYELIQVLQGEGGTVTDLLSHTASLTSTIADKDHVIGEVIDNLNKVLDTLNDRDDQFTKLVVTVRDLVSGLSKDRNTIGEAIDSIGDLTDTTASLLDDARPPLKDDIEQLGELAHNLNDNQDIVENFLTTLPGKLDRLTPLGTHASWFNFYLCDATIGLSGIPLLPPITIGPISNTHDSGRCLAGPPYGSPPNSTPVPGFEDTPTTPPATPPTTPSLPGLPGLPGLLSTTGGRR